MKVDNVIAIYDKNSLKKDIVIKSFGNGAHIPFIKAHIGKKVVVIVIDD